MTDREAALAEYVREAAYELVMDGEFDEEIKAMILEGRFDDTVIERIKILSSPSAEKGRGTS